ncbi:MAG: FxLYD domain-containing protein [Synergistaceae bacterium]|nr:FxLYD domain-containing protein [Synergistaceae bacterium]
MKKAILLGLFFGMGFASGFFSGFFYAGTIPEPAFPAPGGKQSAEITEPPAEIRPDAPAVASGEPETPPLPIKGNIDLELIDSWMDSDENGLYITGTVKNISSHSFDAVRVAFDLCDSGGKPYTTVTDRNSELMEPGDEWGFTIYIHYTDIEKLSAYRLQSIMGVTRR